MSLKSMGTGKIMDFIFYFILWNWKSCSNKICLDKNLLIDILSSEIICKKKVEGNFWSISPDLFSWKSFTRIFPQCFEAFDKKLNDKYTFNTHAIHSTLRVQLIYTINIYSKQKQLWSHLIHIWNHILSTLFKKCVVHNNHW